MSWEVVVLGKHRHARLPIFLFCFVDWRPCLSWSKWTFAVATVGPANLSKLIESIPGHVTKLPFPMAVLNVVRAGLNAHPCKYLAKSGLLWVLLTMIFNVWRAYTWYVEAS